MAKISFKGNIGKKDAVLRTVGEGENKYSVCDFFICENIGVKGTDSERGVWYKVTLWRGYADKLHQYLKSGRYLMVEGDVSREPHVYTSGNSVRSYVEVNAREITFLDNKGKQEAASPEDAEGEIETTTGAEEDTPW